MDKFLARVYRYYGVGPGIGVIALFAGRLACAADPASPLPLNRPVSLFVTPPVYIYRSPSVMVQDAVAASSASEVETRAPPSIERPDDWACRTSNVLTRSSLSRSNDGKSISDYEHLMPKC